MKPVDHDQRLALELTQSTMTLRAYAGSDVSRAACELLDRLEASYLNDLVAVRPDGLVRLQACIRQVRALRATLDGSSTELPKV